MRKMLFLILVLQLIYSGCFLKNNTGTIIKDHIAVLPYKGAGFFVSGTEPIDLNDKDIFLIESLLKKFTREFNDKNDYPYNKINLEQCYRQYYAYLFTSRNMKYVSVRLFEDIPNNLDWQKVAINGSYGDHFEVTINITKKSYDQGEFVPGRDVYKLISSWENRIIYTIDEEDERSIYSAVLNAVSEYYGGKINSWNINKDINLRDHVDIRRSAREEALWLKRNEPSLSDDLLESFIENNSQFYSFNEKMNIFHEDIKYSWYDSKNSSEENSVGFSRNSVDFLVFSRIGFNTDKTFSLLYVGDYMGYGGHGMYYFIEKENNNWKIKDVIPSWIS